MSASMPVETPTIRPPEQQGRITQFVERGAKVLQNLRGVVTNRATDKLTSAVLLTGIILGGSAAEKALAMTQQVPKSSDSALVLPGPNGPPDPPGVSIVSVAAGEPPQTFKKEVQWADGTVDLEPTTKEEKEMAKAIADILESTQLNKPAAASPDKPPLTAEELHQTKTDIDAINNSIKAWIRPEILAKHPELQYVTDPESLKAYRDSKFLYDITEDTFDVRAPGDRVLHFSAEGPTGSKFYDFYQRSDGTVYKVHTYIMVNGDGSFTDQLRKKGIPPERAKSLLSEVYNIPADKLQWNQGAQTIGTGQSGNLKIEAKTNAYSGTELTVEDLDRVDEGNPYTPAQQKERKSAREQYYQEQQRIKNQNEFQQSRQPPSPDNSQKPLTQEETQRYQEGLQTAIEIAKKWINPDVLSKNPQITDLTALSDSQRLKALRDRKYLDAYRVQPNNRVYEYHPFGEKGGTRIDTNISPEGRIKGRIWIDVDANGDPTTQNLSGGVARNDVPGVTQDMFNIPQLDMDEWQKHQWDSPTSPWAQAKITVDDYDVTLEGSSSHATISFEQKPTPKPIS